MSDPRRRHALAPPTLARRLAPLRHLPLVLVAAALFPLAGGRRSGDWSLFADGSRMLFGDSGLRLYVERPDLQIGPLGFAAAGFCRVLSGGDGFLAAGLLMSALGVGIVLAVERVALALRDDPVLRARVPLVTLAGGFVFLRAWHDLEIAGHLDDALALAGAAAAAWAVAARRPWLAGVALGLAPAAKPWAVMFLPLVLALPRPQALRALAAAGAVVAAAWLPFVLAEPHTLTALRYAIPNAPTSALRVLGVEDATTPPWLRPVQLLLGAAAAAVAVRRGHWTGALLAALAVRITLDPGTYSYYTTGAVFGALLWDAAGSRLALPLVTVGTFLALETVRPLELDPSAQGAARLAAMLVAVAAVVAGSVRRGPEARPG